MGNGIIAFAPISVMLFRNTYKVILSMESEESEGIGKSFETEQVEQIIYKGNYADFVKKIKVNVADIKENSLHANDLDAALQRVDFLNTKTCDPNSPSDVRFLHRNRVFWGFSLKGMLQHTAPTKWMTYKGQDGKRGVFIFHYNGQRRQNIPLVIVVPPALDGDAMIEDWYTSNLDQIETDNAMADRYGFAIAWIYAEGRNYAAVKTEVEITAVLNRLKLEYSIDEQHIFIMGDCEGGRRALVQLALSPHRYAACVAASPITLSGGNDGVPIDLLPRMGDAPILIRHGTDDDITPVVHSRRFYEEAQKLNMPVTYVEVSGSHVNVSKDGHRYVFDFFRSDSTTIR